MLTDFGNTGGRPAKSGGLGDLELFCFAAPIEVGNRVWLDSDKDGIQDPSESALSGITVGLYSSGGTLLATAVTDSDGYYFFIDNSHPLSATVGSEYGVATAIDPNTNYEIRIDTTQSRLMNYGVATPNGGGDSSNNNLTDLNDSDGVLTDNDAVIAFTTGDAGHNNHTLDFGFVIAEYDLALIKELNSTGPFKVGDNVTFDITVMNQGERASGIYTVTDNLPAELGFVSAIPAPDSAPAVGNSGNISWVDSGLTISGTVTDTYTYTLVAQILSLPTGAITNTAEITGDSGNDDDSDPTDGSGATDTFNDSDVTNDQDPGDEDDSDFETITDVREYDLALIKSLNSTGPFKVGDNVTFDITVMNQGEWESGVFSVTDSLPPELGFVSASPAPSSDPGVGNSGAVVWIDSGLTISGTVSDTVTYSLVTQILSLPTGSLKNVAEITGDSGVDDDSDPTDGSGATDTFNDSDVTNDQDPGDEDDSDFETITVEEYDLALIKTVDTGGLVVAGDTVTFTVEIMNQGTYTSGNFTVQDTLPAGLNYISASPAPDAAPSVGTNGTITWNDSGLGSTDRTSYTILAEIDASASGVLTNTAEIVSDSGVDDDSDPTDDSENSDTFNDSDVTNDNDPGDEDDSDFETVTVSEYDLALVKSLETAGPYFVGSTITYTIAVMNQGDVPSGNYSVADTLPSELTYVDASPSPASDPGVGNSGTITWNATGLAAGTITTFTLTANISTTAGLPITNTAEITADSGPDDDSDPTDGSGSTDTFDDSDVTNDNDPGDEDDSDFAPLTVSEYDLALIKRLITTAPYGVGDQVTFEILVMNQGTLDSGNFTVEDTLPAELTYVSANPAPASDPGVGNSGVISWNSSGLAAGDITTYTLVAEIDSLPVSSVRNVAEITADSGPDDDSDPTDNSDTTDTFDDNDVTNDKDTGDEDDSDFATLPIDEYDLALIKSFAAGNSNPFLVGDQITFNIVVMNQGDLDSGNFTVEDTLPAELTFVSADPAPASDPGVGNSGTVVWNDTGLTLMQQRTYTITVEVAGVPSGTLKNLAEITADSGSDDDSDPTDNSDTTDTFNDDDVTNDQDAGDEDDSDFEEIIVEEYDLALIKELESIGPHKVGDQIEFSIMVMNQGVADSGNFAVEDTLPAELTFVSASPSPTSDPGVGNSGVISWSDSGLAAGDLVTYTVIAEIISRSSGTITNTAEIVSDSGIDDDSDPTDNSDTTDTFDDSDVTNDSDPSDEDDSDFEPITVEEYDLALIKTNESTGPFVVGDFVTMTLTVMNQGTIDSGQVEVTDPLPAEFIFISASPSASSDPGLGNNGDVVWTIANLAPSEISTYTVVVMINSLPAGSDIINTAEISDDSGVDDDSDPTDGSEATDTIDDSDVTNDNDPGDEDDSDLTTITPVYEYDLALVKRIVSSPPHARDFPITFEIVVMNQGQVDSGDFTVADRLPTQLTYLSANPAPASDPGVGNTGTIMWADTGLAPGDTMTYTVVAMIATSEEPILRNSAEILSDSGVDDDSDPTDNSGTTDTFDDEDVTNDNDPGDEDDSDFEQFEVIIYDYGDLPDEYGTIENGTYITPALHVIVPELSLGPDVNNEDDGDPGDNADNATDDNGIVFLTPIMPGETVEIEVTVRISGTAGMTATVGAWLDLNNDGNFTAGEFFTTEVTNPTNGNNLVTTTISFTAPADVGDEVFARFRVSTTPEEVNDISLSTGIATSGEVEDYVLLSLGNRVFFDTGEGTTNNGQFDASNGELGVDGVTVELYTAGQTPGVDTPFATVETSNGGEYLFTGLPPGDYFAHVAVENFADGGPLAGYYSSDGQTNDNQDEGSNENGIDANPLINGISSGVVTLSPGGAPAAGLDGNTANSDLTLDFGFQNAAPTSVGLIRFNVRRISDLEVELTWETASEINNFGFKVFRSDDRNLGVATQIAFVPSATGGNSDSITAYRLTDTLPTHGTYTYWLVDVELDGDEKSHSPFTIELDNSWDVYLPAILK